MPVEAALLLPRALAEAMIAQARAAAPAEMCGLIAGSGRQAVRLFPVANADPDIHRYTMEPQAQFEAMQAIEHRGWEMLAIYHSHTHTPAYPSPTDIELAFYPDTYYAIVSLQDAEHPVIRCFQIVDGQVSETTCRIT